MSDSSRDDAPTTPPAAIRPGHPEPVSGLRSEREHEETRDTDLTLEEHAPAANPDTLMSVPKPALHSDLPLDTRLRELEDRLEALEARVTQAERSRELRDSTRATPWWFWLLFLVGLAISWRLLELLH
jgi:hypothetical protein